jgi:hypothetical protein
MKSVTENVIITETPFSKRHCCWFCGEPNNSNFVFPPNSSLSSYHEDKYLVLDCPHPAISVPSCNECTKIALRARANSIWLVKAYVKRQLIKLHRKELAIGVNWTKQELASSEFESGNFAGFARSAWFMYELAKERVNYAGWKLIANGIELDETSLYEDSAANFCFDGVKYPTIEDAILHYAQIFSLDEHYVKAVLQHLSGGNISTTTFSKAIRFCRLLVNATPNERKHAFKTLIEQ